MMAIKIGEAVRHYRKEAGLSQEQLAEGVCGFSTLSRIETGEQIPQKQTFCALMDRLGVTNLQYESFFEGADYEKERIKECIINCFESGEINRVDEYLWSFNRLMDENSVMDNQFLKMMKMLWYQKLGAENDDYVQKCLELLQLSKPEIDIEICDFKEMSLNYIEQVILNNIGLGYLKEGEIQRAHNALSGLFVNLMGLGENSYRNQKKKAVSCNNLALVYIKMEQPQQACELCDYGLRCLSNCGGSLCWMTLMATKAVALEKMGKQVEAKGLKAYIKMSREMLGLNEEIVDLAVELPDMLGGISVL